MNARWIVIDGKTYTSVDEMPEDVRRMYEHAMRGVGDSNHDGVPDRLETLTTPTDQNNTGRPDSLETMGSNMLSASTKIIVDGAEYNRFDELPQEVRAKYEQAMGPLDANRNGVPDFLEGMMNSSNQVATVQPAHAVPAPRVSKPLPSNPPIEPESTSGWRIALFALAVTGVCALGAISMWYFFLR